MQEKRTIIRKKINIYLLYYSVVTREREDNTTGIMDIWLLFIISSLDKINFPIASWGVRI